MLVLGLDPSLTNYGWALHDTEAEGADRCVDRGRFQTKSKQFRYDVERYVHLREQLRSKINELNPDAMGIEHPVFNEDYSEGMYALYEFSLEAIQDEAKDLVLFQPPQVKSWAKEAIERPRGWKMGKSDMVDAAKFITGGKGRWSHDEADAYHVACIAGRFWKFFCEILDEEELTPVEKHMFARTHTFVKGKRKGQTERTGIIHRESDRFFLWSVE
jgi:Holliday junction resolvasome RuvABC endonuclease subunit